MAKSAAFFFMKNLRQKNERTRAQHNDEPKRLPFRTPLNGISDRTLKNHHDKLYAGYVDKKNEIQTQLEELGRRTTSNGGKSGNSTFSELRTLKESETYAVNGVYLHEWYFEILGGDGTFENA